MGTNLDLVSLKIMSLDNLLLLNWSVKFLSKDRLVVDLNF